MPLFTPKKVVLNWYRYDVSFSIELMASFVEGVEKQATESVLNYRKTKKAEGYQGLDGESWDVDQIVEHYFPALQRRSAFLTLWGFLEHELDKLCSLYQSEKSFTLVVSDLAGKGIDRSIAYLEKLAGLKELKASPEWNELKSVQRIRNVIAHDGGKLIDRQNKPKEEILSCMKNVGFLSGDNEVMVEQGFLSKVVGACDKYFKRVDDAIQTREIALLRSELK